MSKIAFFSIAAYGHTNPTIEVVRELTQRGHQVTYYSFAPFRERIEAAGAEFVSCEGFISMLDKKDEKKVGKDLSLLVRMVTEISLAMDRVYFQQIKASNFDGIVADSMAYWGKFFAKRLNLPFICSTTTFAFNKYSARIMKQDLSSLFRSLFGWPSILRDIKALQQAGFPIKNVLDIIQNDNETNTIVYTSELFQPYAETFSERYAFVGPSIAPTPANPADPERKTVYISMGTVNNKLAAFYHNCIKAFGDGKYRVILSIGEWLNSADFNPLPEYISVHQRVNQIATLQSADAFLTHCGMNSVNEGLYFGVPLVTYPQTGEQGGVARRVNELEAGLPVTDDAPEKIRTTVDALLADPKYRQNAMKISRSFREAGGAARAADRILQVIGTR